MSDRAGVTALGGVRFEGYVTIEEAGAQGMIALRCDLADPAVRSALEGMGLPLPGTRCIVQADWRANGAANGAADGAANGAANGAADGAANGAAKGAAGAHLETGGVPRADLPQETGNGRLTVGWMSSDELLLIVPQAEVAPLLARLAVALNGLHHLASDVSDARAMFRIRGDAAREVLAKLCPVDLGAFDLGWHELAQDGAVGGAPMSAIAISGARPLVRGELRRTRAAQVAAAIWISDDREVTLVTFRSVAGYVFDLLSLAATPGSEVNRTDGPHN